MSISIKLMGVPGPKLMDEEKFTQDMFGVSPPTFVTPDVKANAQLQIESLKNAPIFYFVNLHRPHVLDFIMQGLWIKTQSSPFEAPYFSCVPYLLGEGQAMQYSVWPKIEASARRSRACRCARPTTTCARRWSARSTHGDVELDFRMQLQTDPHLMPIENAGVLWPEKLSPRVSVATLRMPRQTFDSPAQMEFAKRLSYNPWHCIAEHRPLGNQSRARKRMYWELSTAAPPDERRAALRADRRRDVPVKAVSRSAAGRAPDGSADDRRSGLGRLAIGLLRGLEVLGLLASACRRATACCPCRPWPPSAPWPAWRALGASPSAPWLPSPP